MMKYRIKEVRYERYTRFFPQRCGQRVFVNLYDVDPNKYQKWYTSYDSAMCVIIADKISIKNSTPKETIIHEVD